MITVRRAGARGITEREWLRSAHTFSFGDYYDPDFMGFRSLRVINDDIVAPAAGFGMHAHRDMEIVTLVLSGVLEHKDSLGSGSVIRPGMVQRMTAGRGLKHSEFNPSKTEPVRFLQIWIEPSHKGLEPSYQEAALEFRDGVAAVASADGVGAAVRIHQDARISLWRFEPGQERTVPLNSGRYAWLQIASGALRLNTDTLQEGDGVAVSGESAISLRASAQAEVVVFDVG